MTHEEIVRLLNVGKLKLAKGVKISPNIEIGLLDRSTGGWVKFITMSTMETSLDITQEDLNNTNYRLLIRFRGDSNSTIQTGTIKPMLYQDGDGTWEPFTGGIASPNPKYPQDPKFVGDYNEYTQKYDIDFMTSGKNLFNINGNVNVNGYNGSQVNLNTVEDGILTCNVNGDNAHGVGQRLYGLKGKAISVSAKIKSFGEATSAKVLIYDGGGNYRSYSYISTPDNVSAINNYTCQTDDVVVAFVSVGGTGVQFYDIMVNYGAKFVDYEPFTGFETTTVELNQPLRELPNGVKDTIENGVVTRRVGEITFDGSSDESWRLLDSKNGYTRFIMSTNGISSVSLLCDKLKVVNGVPDTYTQECIIEYIDNVMRVVVSNDNASSVEQLRTWLQSNPITVWYELAAPTTEQITLPTLPAYSPYTMVWTNNDVKSRIDLHYYTMFKGDKGDDGTVHSATAPSDKTKLWFDTTDNLLKYWNGTTWEVTNDFAGDINDMKQNITTEYTSAINQLKESLTTLVEKLQTSTTDNSTLIEQLSSQIVQNSSSISLVTNSIKSITDNISGLATKEEISQWARFENGVLELGASNSPFAVKLSNTELGFYQNGSRIAYLSNQQLNIEYAIVMTKLNIGTFSWNYDATDGLTLT